MCAPPSTTHATSYSVNNDNNDARLINNVGAHAGIPRGNGGQTQAPPGEADINARMCRNCATRVTALWMRDDKGNILCNACALYFKFHGSRAPSSMDIQRRKRMRAVTTSLLAMVVLLLAVPALLLAVPASLLAVLTSMVALLLVMPALLRRVAALLLSVLTSLLAMVALLLVVPALLLPMAALLLAVAASPLTVYALVLTVAASLLPVALLMTVHMLLLAMVASLLAEPALLRRAAASLLPVAASLLPVAASLLPVAVSLLPVPASLLALLASLLAVSLLVRHLQSGSSNNNAITDQAVAAALGLRGGLGNWGGKRNVLAQLPLVPYPTPAFDPLVTELLAHGNPLHSILAVILVFCTAPSLLQVGHVLDLSWSEVRDYLLPVAELLEPLGLPEQYYSNFRISRQLQDFLLDPSRPETFVDIPRWHAFVAKWCFDRSYLFDRSHLNSDKRDIWYAADYWADHLCGSRPSADLWDSLRRSLIPRRQKSRLVLPEVIAWLKKVDVDDTRELVAIYEHLCH